MSNAYGVLFRADRMVLVLLAHLGLQTSAQLQNRLGRTPGSISTSVTNLIRLGLAQRSGSGYECIDPRATMAWFRAHDPEVLHLCGVR